MIFVELPGNAVFNAGAPWSGNFRLNGLSRFVGIFWLNVDVWKEQGVAPVITNEGLKTMGFTEVVPEGTLQAQFKKLSVFELNGIQIDDLNCEYRTSPLAGLSYQIAISTSIEECLERVIGSDWALLGFDTGESVGIFLVLSVDSTDFTDCESGRKRENTGDILVTNSCFKAALTAADSGWQRVSPLLIAALTAAFSAIGRDFSMKELFSIEYGRTRENNLVVEINPNFSFSISGVHRVEAQAIGKALDIAVSWAPRLQKKSARHFTNAKKEVDPLKKFLSFFLCIEVETHYCFSLINHSEKLSELLPKAEGVSEQYALQVITRDFEKRLVSLGDRFVWCAAILWPHLSGDDISIFREIKKTRDDIAHGNIYALPTGDEYKAETLARKIIFALR